MLIDELPRITTDLAFTVFEYWWLILGVALVIDLVVTLPLYVLWKKGKEEEQ